jgi:hypothetical protein
MERYIEGEAYILMVLAVRGESCKYAAFLKRPAPTELRAIQNVAPRAYDSGAEPNRQNSPMLIDVVQLMQSPEAVVLSSIRFQPLQVLLDILPHSTHLSFKSGFLVLGGWDFFGDWKSRRGSWLSAVRSDEFARKVVERTVEVLDGVTNDKRELARNWPSIVDIGEVLASIRIQLETRLYTGARS